MWASLGLGLSLNTALDFEQRPRWNHSWRQAPKATGHLSTHVATLQEKHPMFGQIHLSQCCSVTSLLIHPHQETVCPALVRTAPNWAHLKLSQQTVTSAQPWVLSSGSWATWEGQEWPWQSISGTKKWIMRSLSWIPQPVPLEWQHWLTLPRALSWKQPQSLAFSTAWRFAQPQTAKCSSPLWVMLCFHWPLLHTHHLPPSHEGTVSFCKHCHKLQGTEWISSSVFYQHGGDFLTAVV